MNLIRPDSDVKHPAVDGVMRQYALRLESVQNPPRSYRWGYVVVHPDSRKKVLGRDGRWHLRPRGQQFRDNHVFELEEAFRLGRDAAAKRKICGVTFDEAVEAAVRRYDQYMAELLTRNNLTS